MARTAAKDTSVRRELKVLDSATRYLDALDESSRARVLDWTDALVDGEAETAGAELKAMAGIAKVFAQVSAETRDGAVRWLNDHYGKEEPVTEARPL
jgi:phage-related protein